jgi:hypothetical protein
VLCSRSKPRTWWRREVGRYQGKLGRKVQKAREKWKGLVCFFSSRRGERSYLWFLPSFSCCSPAVLLLFSIYTFYRKGLEADGCVVFLVSSS